jgi:hypothetical protein
VDRLSNRQWKPYISTSSWCKGTTNGNLVSTGGSLTSIASGNGWFPLVVVLRKPLVEMCFHWRLLNPTVCDLCCINTPSFSLIVIVARSQLPLEVILEVQISQNTRRCRSSFFRRMLLRKVGLCFSCQFLSILA